MHQRIFRGSALAALVIAIALPRRSGPQKRKWFGHGSPQSGAYLNSLPRTRITPLPFRRHITNWREIALPARMN